MNDLLIRSGECVAVCDGAKALLLCNDGDAKFPNLKTVKVFTQEDLATREQGTDAPGRAMNSVGGARSAVGQTDWHDQAEQSFLARFVEYLDATAREGKIKSLIVVAPPRALGVLRPAYTQQLRSILRAEIDKDLVKLPVHVIEKHLTGA